MICFSSSHMRTLRKSTILDSRCGTRSPHHSPASLPCAPTTASQTDTTAPKYRFPAMYFRTSQCTGLNSPAGTFLVVMAMETTVAKSVPLGIHVSKANVGGCFGFCKQQTVPRERSHVTQAQKHLTQDLWHPEQLPCYTKYLPCSKEVRNLIKTLTRLQCQNYKVPSLKTEKNSYLT